MTLEIELDKIVYEKVKRGDYPDQPIPVDDKELVEELNNLKKCKIPRPKTKSEYFGLLESLERQISEIRVDNEKKSSQYLEDRKQIDSKFESDIATAKLDKANIAEALCRCIDSNLDKTLWYTVKDSGLGTTKQAVADKWRSDMMSITDYETVDEAVERFNTLMATKPDYRIKWTK